MFSVNGRETETRREKRRKKKCGEGGDSEGEDLPERSVIIQLVIEHTERSNSRSTSVVRQLFPEFCARGEVVYRVLSTKDN